MAYKDFHTESIYKAPDVDILAEGLMEGAKSSAEAIGNIFKTMAAQKAAKRTAAEQYKFDLGAGKFQNDDNIFQVRGLNLTKRGKQDVLISGKISPELQLEQEIALMDKRQSDWQYAKFKDNAERIASRGKNDKYFDEDYEHQKNFIAANGENNDIDYRTRGERLDAYDKTIFTDPKALKGKVYTYDYVGTFRTKEKTRATGSPTTENTIYDKYTFIGPDGAPGVTTTHAKEYMNSRPDGSVARWVESLVDDDMAEDIAYNKQRNPYVAKMDDETARLYLKANPTENMLNQKDYSTRVLEKAQQQLRDAAGLSSKTDYQTKVDKSVTGGNWDNDAIGGGDTVHTDNPLVTGGQTTITPTGGFETTLNIPTNKMPGKNLRLNKGKIGQPIPMNINPRNGYNIRTGENQINTGTTSFNLEGYQAAAYNNKGQFVPIDHTALDKMPNSAFKNLQSSLQIGLRGFTLDKGNTLGDLATREEELDNEYAAAVKARDVDAQTQIQDQIFAIEELKKSMNLGSRDFSETDLLSAYRRAGISTTTMKRDMIMQASEPDLDLINQTTKGLNLKDKSKWTLDMIDADVRYQKRYQEAVAAGFKDEKSETQKYTTPKKPVTTIPAGNVKVISPDGKTGYIPAAQLQDALNQGYKQSQ